MYASTLSPSLSDSIGIPCWKVLPGFAGFNGRRLYKYEASYAHRHLAIPEEAHRVTTIDSWLSTSVQTFHRTSNRVLNHEGKVNIFFGGKLRTLARGTVLDGLLRVFLVRKAAEQLEMGNLYDDSAKQFVPCSC